MSVRSQIDRLDEIEISSTPKEWVIRLLDYMRQYPTMEDFLKSLEKAEFEDCLLIKPLSMLRKQAEARHPGQGLQAKRSRAELCRELQIEFEQLKILIRRINEVVLQKTESALQAHGVLKAWLHSLLLESRLQSTADCIKACLRRTGQDRPEFSCVLSLLQGFYENNTPTSASMIETFAASLADLLKSLLEHEAGVKMLQDRYFDGHPVLFSDIENALSQGINSLKETIFWSRIGFSGRQRARFRLAQKKFGAIDVLQLQKEARMLATVDVLKLNGINLEDRWNVFQVMSKLELTDSLGSP